MYHVFYPNPLQQRSEEHYLHEEADTKEEAVELGERAAASWRGIDRSEVMIFDGDGAMGLPDEAEGHRCPHCGCLIDAAGFRPENASEDDYDDDYGAYKLHMECPECGEQIGAWFDGDPEDGDTPEFHEIDEYD